MSKNGPLDFEATIDAKMFNSMLDEMERRIRGVSGTVVKEGAEMDKTFRNIGAGMAAYFSAQQLGDFVTQVANVRGEFQQLEISFETMLKNKSLSDKLMADVVEFAAKTPFDLQQVATGAKQLLAYGTEAQNIIPTMRQLGDVAAGLTIPFGDLVYLYGTSATQGKLMTKDLMQFAGRGIPIIDELSKTLDVSKSRVLELASEGKIGFTELQQVISNLTSEAGMFAGMMEKQADSILGLQSNFTDAWDKMLNDIGKSNEQTIEDSIRTSIAVVENYQKIIDLLKVLIATYGVYRAAILVNTWTISGYSKALGVAAIKQHFLNLAQKASPWGLALAGVTALVGALWAFNRVTTATNEVQKEINSRIVTEVGQMKNLFNSLENVNLKGEKRSELIRQINEQYGSYLPNLLSEKSTIGEIRSAYDLINSSMRERIELQVKESKAKELYLSLFEKEEEYKRIAAMSVKQYNKEFQIVEGVKGGARHYALEKLRKEMQEIREEYDRFLDEAQAKTQTTANLTIKEPVADIKPDKIKTLAQQLKEVQQLYENYYRWVERYGKESADKQFENLISGGQSYLEYLERQIKTLESKPVKSDKDVNDLSTYLGEKNDLTGAKTRIQLFEEEVDSAKEKYTDLVDYINYLKGSLLAVGAFDGSELSFEKIRILYEKMTEAERDFIKESASTYQKAIEEAAGFAEKRILIEKEYAAEVKKLDPVSLGDEKYAEAIAALEKIKKEKLYEVLKNEVEATEAYKELTNNFDRLTTGEASRYLGLLKDQLNKLKDQPEIYNQINNLIAEIEGQLANTKAGKLSDALSESSKLMDIVISKLEGVDESFLAIANSISSVIGQLSTVSDSFAINSATGKASNPLQGFSSLAGIFFTIADGLDKQFGMQKKIADIEESRAEYNRQMSLTLETITSELDKQLRLLDELSLGEAYNPSIEALKESIRSASEELENLRLDFAKSPPNVKITFDISHLKTIFQTDDTAKALNQAFSEGLITEDQYNLAVQYLSTIENAEEQLKQLHEEYKDAILGTTSEAITDSIIEGLMAGKRGIEDFAGTFEDMMKQALINSMMVKAIQPQIDKFMDTFFAVTNDADGLSQADISSLQSVWEVLVNGWGKTFDEMESMFPDLFDATNQANNLAGAIKGVTEETAGLIAGQMNAIRMNQAHVLALMDEQLAYQMEIAENTRHNRKLNQLDLLPQILNELRKGSSSASTSSRAAGGE